MLKHSMRLELKYLSTAVESNEVTCETIRRNDNKSNNTAVNNSQKAKHEKFVVVT